MSFDILQEHGTENSKQYNRKVLLISSKKIELKNVI